MNIFPIQNNNIDLKNVQFQGVTRLLEKQIYRDGQREINAVIAQRTRNSLVAGQFPKSLMEKIPAELRAVAIPEIIKTFGIVSKAIREYQAPLLNAENFFSYTESDRHRPKFANDLLTDVFRKYGILKERDADINLEYFGSGVSSQAFKISGIIDDEKDDEFLLKVYYQLENSNWHDAKTKGIHAELNNAAYWRKQAGQDTQKGKFYFGDIETGYMVTNIIDEDSRAPQRYVSPYRFGINYDRINLPKFTDRFVYDSRMKGYNYKHSGMPVVNIIKNKSPFARNFLEKMESATPEARQELWNKTYASAGENETKLEALALGIKYLKNKSEHIDKLLEHNSNRVDIGLAYLLKYLTKNEALKYFEQLASRGDKDTQVVLFNEIPLLGKRFDKDKRIIDDVHVSLMEILPEKLLLFYEIAEKYAVPESIEHLASSVYMLPITKLEHYYTKLASIDNSALKERLSWKINFLPDDFQETAIELINK